MPGELSAVNVGFSYGGRAVLANVNLVIPAGSQVGLTGPSGSGKTTLARILAGLTVPSAGSVSCNGAAVRAAGNGSIAMLFQSPRRSCSPRMTLRSVIAEGMSGIRRSMRRKDVDTGVRQVAERVQLTADLLDRYPHEVSDGQLQRACLARALAAGPDYLICDEATAMLDAATTAAVVRVIGEEVAARDLGVLALSHDQRLLEAWCGSIADLPDLTHNGPALPDPALPDPVLSDPALPDPVLPDEELLGMALAARSSLQKTEAHRQATPQAASTESARPAKL